jgi:hypothetical protein
MNKRILTTTVVQAKIVNLRQGDEVLLVIKLCFC